MLTRICLKQINILTLNPEYFSSFLQQYLVRKALELRKIKINFINFRDFSTDKNRSVDDYIYGGGAGMLLKCEPLYFALETIPKPNYTIILTPSGEEWNQQLIQDVIQQPNVTIICGRYEGFDERVKNFCNKSVAVGKFVISNGEIFAMAIIDSMIRYLPGLISTKSLEDESFSGKYLHEYPQYTRPKLFKSLKVPEVLMNGNHKEIERWKQLHAILAKPIKTNTNKKIKKSQNQK